MAKCEICKESKKILFTNCRNIKFKGLICVNCYNKIIKDELKQDLIINDFHKLPVETQKEIMDFLNDSVEWFIKIKK